MPSSSAVRAVIFDFVNTLVPLREQEFLRILQAVYERVHPHAPHITFDAFVQHYVRIRDEQYERNLPHLRENDFYERMATLWRRLTGHPPNPKTVYGLMRQYAVGFESAVQPAPYLPSLLRTLSERYLLAVLSNYPYTPCVHRVLNRHQLSRYFASVMVSAEVGIVKPHPALFKVTLYRLGVSAEQAIYVGDDWCADMIGASRAGMRGIYTREWRTDPDPCAGHTDGSPLAHICSLTELPQILRSL
ncbi:MAG: HAD family hydrolase [Chthonomonadetes bacterium]|nr:HAD family hydrolase [Chthonomonadetes bacterium]